MKSVSLKPIDKFALSAIALLSIVTGGLVLGAKACGKTCFFRTDPHIQQFSWENQKVGKLDRAFILTFDRPMDHASVEKNLVIDPPLPGKISWSGRRMAYTVTTPIPYGETYQIQLQDAKERFRGNDELGASIEPFMGEFQSRDRAIAYIGTQGEEQGRLIFSNLTEKSKQLLTPADLVVVDFKFYPTGDKILFSAALRGRGIEGLRELELYTVAINRKDSEKNPLSQFQAESKIEKILDNQDYQNNQFDLGADGETIVVQRVNRSNPADFDLWMLKAGQTPQKLNISGGEFLIAPDGETLAVARGEGIGILPLKPEAEPLDFLPKFGELLSFSADGTAAAMVDFNTDDAQLRYTRSLFYVNNQGVQKELLNTEGSIIDCQFDPMQTYLYCLLTELLEGDEYQEQPYFAKIDLKTAKLTPLVALPNYRETQISLAPDGLALIFDQVITTSNPAVDDALTTNSGETIAGGRLWLLIPPTQESEPMSQPELQELGLLGIRPQWAP